MPATVDYRVSYWVGPIEIRVATADGRVRAYCTLCKAQIHKLWMAPDRAELARIDATGHLHRNHTHTGPNHDEWCRAGLINCPTEGAS
jgi:hypothetical protein